MRKGYGPAGMYSAEEGLAEMAVEEAAQHAVAEGLAAEGVAVAEEELDAVDSGSDSSIGGVDYSQAYLIAEVVEKPDVVITYKPDDFDTGVGHAGELSEKTDVAAGHDGAVFIPVVEDIAEQIEGTGVVLDGLQEVHDAVFVRSAVGDI